MNGFFSIRRGVFFPWIILTLSVIFSSACRGNPSAVGVTPLPSGPPPSSAGGSAQSKPVSGGIAAEIRSFVELGTPPSLIKALELIQAKNLGNTEFSRVMIAVIAHMIRKIYPDIQVRYPPLDPPRTHEYTRLLEDADQGKYTPPAPDSADYFEHVLPFFALLPAAPEEFFLRTIPDLQKAKQLNPDSALAPYFLGMAYERSGLLLEASAEYSLAYELSRDCYPAVLSLTRIMNAAGRREEAMVLLSDLVIRYPNNIAIKRAIALAYYHNQDWSRAERAIAELLGRNSRDSEFILLQAHVLVEQGQFLQAQAPLDLYAEVNPTNRLYLFLRARIQAGGYRNRDAALNYLRAILAADPGDDEVAVYTTRLLMGSQRREDQSEGRRLLQRLLEKEPLPLAVVSLEVEDAIRREAWKEAEVYLERILEERRSPQDLLFAYQIERGLGNHADALAYAREVYERDPANDEGTAAYISALIDTGRRTEAARMIENQLGSVPGGAVKSRYYYLRSRLRNNEELTMNDLRSSLFEEPRNLAALIAMFEIYHRRRDERRAVYYLKQALALAPENPRLRRYESEYGALLDNANSAGSTE